MVPQSIQSVKPEIWVPLNSFLSLFLHQHATKSCLFFTHWNFLDVSLLCVPTTTLASLLDYDNGSLIGYSTLILRFQVFFEVKWNFFQSSLYYGTNVLSHFFWPDRYKAKVSSQRLRKSRWWVLFGLWRSQNWDTMRLQGSVPCVKLIWPKSQAEVGVKIQLEEDLSQVQAWVMVSPTLIFMTCHVPLRSKNETTVSTSPLPSHLNCTFR